MREEHDKTENENNTAKRQQVTCSECKESFSSNSTLYRHQRTRHGMETVKSADGPDGHGQLICPLCESHHNSFISLDKHLESAHSTVLQHHGPISFNSMTDFEKWKREQEENQPSFFSKRNKKQSANGEFTVYYRCNRSGHSRRQVEGESTRLHWAPSMKISATCPARMILRKRIDGFEVDYQSCHVGHKLSSKYLRLTKEERLEIAGKLEKQSLDSILDEISQSTTNFSSITRYQATNKHDLHNIMKEFNLVKSRLCQNDLVSVNTWVQTQMALGDDNCVLGHKEQGVADPDRLLQEDDFVLIIMTKYQSDVLASYAKDKVLVDSTHKTTGYDFQLTSLVTIDEYDTGCPVAFCLSSRVDTNTMKYFFKKVRGKVGLIESNVFMSDDTNVYFNAWDSEMSTPLHRLLCTWHVDKNWRDKIKEKVKGDEKKADVYKGCRVLLESLEEEDFQETLTNFLQMCKDDPDTELFYDYFKTYYAARPHLWAYCYRKKLRLNTNMFLEALHRTLKYCFLDGKYNRRVDKCIDMLLYYSRRLMLKRLVRNMRNIPSYRMTKIGKSHKESSSIKEDQIEKISDNKWQVKSATAGRGPYLVQIDSSSTCEGCPLSCPICKICIHQFECTCIDYSAKGNFCKHIHACIKPIMAELPDIVNEETTDRFEKEAEAFNIASQADPSRINEVDRRQKLKSLLDAIYASSANVDGPGLDNLCGSAARLLDKSKSLASSSSSFQCTSDSPSADTTGAPANKNIPVQRFHSVKKKRLTLTARYKKPDDQEKQQLQEFMSLYSQSTD